MNKILIFAFIIFASLSIFLFKLVINPRPLNLVLISIDTLRPDHMGVYGYKRNTTPNIDKFAQEATVFSNIYTIMPSTFHSFYTLFTGKDDVFSQKRMRLGTINIDNEADTIITLQKILKQNNYMTAAFVTNPVIGLINTFFRENLDRFSYIDSSIFSEKWGWSDAFRFDEENSEKITSKAVDWLEKNRQKKFFLWLHYSNPHHLYNPPKDYFCQINKNCSDPKYENIVKDGLTINKDCDAKDSQKDNPDYLTNMIDLYDAEILSTDEKVGKIITKLKQLNLFNNSLIIIYADHGEEFNHRIFNHIHTIYHSTIHIPLIIRDPYHLKIKKISQLKDNTDILPTILDLLNIYYDKNKFSGSSMAPFAFFGKKALPKKEQIFFSTPSNDSNKFGVFDGQYKYIMSLTNQCLYKNYKEELYDVTNDPLEENNIINQNKEMAKILKDKLLNKISKIKN
jgi:arylsulfatase A-like enzyme